MVNCDLRLLIIFTFLILYTPLPGQNLFPERGIIYNHQVVPRIDIEISVNDLNIILAPGNEKSDEHFPATFYFDDGDFADTVLNVGFRLRGNTARYSRKKSFKISFNTFESGRKWFGVEKLNLNGEHNDPTVSRSRFCFDLLRDMNIPASRANHVELYINGAYYGVYANIEHIDEEFIELRYGNNDGNLYKCTWPADLNYLGEDPNLYKYTNDGERAYELKRNEEEDDYSDLANLIDVLNNTPISELPCALEPILNVDIVLRSIVFDVLSGNWDGPLFNKNNFYLYHNEETDRFEYIPYDLDNTFGIDWFNIDWAMRNMYIWGHPDEPRPLYWRLLEVPEYLNRFSYYMDQVIQNMYTEDLLFPRLKFSQDQIMPYVELDPFYSLDYGFDLEDFNAGFEVRTPYNHTKKGIKEFVTLRRASSLNQLPPIDLIPILKDPKISSISSSETIIQVEVEEDNQLEKVEFCFKTNSEGEIRCIALFDDGEGADILPNDGLFSAVVSIESAQIFYYFTAIDTTGQSSILPSCGFGMKKLKTGSDVPIAINEFMASNDTTIADEWGDFDDWVEIYNYGEDPVHLDGLYLSDDPENPTKWPFPDTSIAAGGFLLVWTDDEPEQGPLHTTYKLSAGGEYIGIFDSDDNDNALADGIEFGEQATDQAYGRIPDGTGEFQFVQATPGGSNETITSATPIANYAMTFSLGPNPTYDQLYLKSNEVQDRPYPVLITNTLGAIIWTGHWQNDRSIDLDQYPAGVYYLSLYDGSRKIVSERIIKL